MLKIETRYIICGVTDRIEEKKIEYFSLKDSKESKNELIVRDYYESDQLMILYSVFGDNDEIYYERKNIDGSKTTHIKNKHDDKIVHTINL